MKIGIMQPYFFPYLGYWQLLHAVDLYVVYVDGFFRPRGWLNRNRILIQGKAHYITLPVHGSAEMRIKEVSLTEDCAYHKKKLLQSVQIHYGKAAHFKDNFPLLERLISNDEKNLAKYLTAAMQEICACLSISTPLLLSSALPYDRNAPAQEKIFAMCKYLGAEHYVNAVGGKELYRQEDFQQQGIRLSFLEMDPVRYPQFQEAFVPALSIIDVLMFNSLQETRDLLQKYTLTDGNGLPE